MLARTVISLLYTCSDAVAVSIWYKNVSKSFNFQNVSLFWHGTSANDNLFY